jgi:hypothetical protein
MIGTRLDAFSLGLQPIESRLLRRYLLLCIGRAVLARLHLTLRRLFRLVGLCLIGLLLLAQRVEITAR